MNHIVALSGGKDSVAMALRLREVEPETDFTFVCTPTANELPAMVAHWIRLGELLGKPILPVTMGKSLAGEIIRQKCIPNSQMRWCTRMLKIAPFQNFIALRMPCISYVGIRADETDDREGAILTGEVTTRWPLVEWGWGICEVKDYLACRGVTIPDRTDCAWCFFQRLIEWFLLWRDHPDIFEQGAKLEELVGHTFRSDSRDSWPASLRELGAEFAKGRRPKGWAEQLKLFNGMHGRKAMCSVCAR